MPATRLTPESLVYIRRMAALHARTHPKVVAGRLGLSPNVVYRVVRETSPKGRRIDAGVAGKRLGAIINRFQDPTKEIAP